MKNTNVQFQVNGKENTLYFEDSSPDIKFNVEEAGAEYKIYPNIDVLSDSFKELVKRVRKERQNSKRCVSSQPGYDINKTLKQIIESQYYKNDFDSVTLVLLNERKTYSEVEEVLTQIINSNAFIE